MQYPEEGALEILTFEQFSQEMAHTGTIQGTPIGTASIAPMREAVPGTELLKQRVRVSFDFDVIVNDGPIQNARDDARRHNLALLEQFIIADKAKLLEMLTYEVGLELGLSSCETFVETFLPQINFSDQFERQLLRPAIEQLQGESGEYWRDMRDEPPDPQYSDWLSLCTEKLFECFEAEFVSSSCEIVGEQQHDN